MGRMPEVRVCAGCRGGGMGGMPPCDLVSKGDAIPEDGSGEVVCGDGDGDHVC